MKEGEGGGLARGYAHSQSNSLDRLIDALKIDHAMIFCRTNVDCDNLEAFLIQQGGGSTCRALAI